MEGWDLRALAVLERLNAAGHRAVLVGGCVRDRLMGRTPHDYDAATSARPEQIREACAPMRVVGDRRAARDGHRSVRRPAGGGDHLPPGGGGTPITAARTGWSSRGIWGRIWLAGTSP